MDRRGLGRGLSALMADVNFDVRSAPDQGARRTDVLVPIEKLVPNPYQPRRSFAPDALQELADSVKEKGIIQPLIVRETSTGGIYEIVAGERRWRAAQIAQLHELPVIIRTFDDAEVLEIAIIENIQRAELNAIEEAAAYQQLIQRFGHTQEKIAQALSRSRSHIANLLRLLTLPDPVQDLVKQGELSAGHARALISHSHPMELARQIIAEGLSVRETEALVRKKTGSETKPRKERARFDKDADTRSLESDLSANLKMSVSIDHDHGGLGGRLTVKYSTLEELDMLCRALSYAPRDGTD